MAAQIIPITLSANIDVDNQSGVTFNPDPRTSNVVLQGWTETAPAILKDHTSGGSAGLYAAYQGLPFPAHIVAAAFYTFEQAKTTGLALIISTDNKGNHFTKVAFYPPIGSHIGPELVKHLIKDPKITDTAHYASHDMLAIKITSGFLTVGPASTQVTAAFKIEQLDWAQLTPTVLTLHSGVTNESYLELSSPITVTLDGELTKEAEVIKPTSTGSAGEWQARDPNIIPDLGEVLKPDIAGAAFYRWGAPTELLILAVARWSDGRTVTKAAVWPAIGATPSARIVELVLNDTRFTDTVILRGPKEIHGIPSSTQVTSRFYRTGKGPETAFFAQFDLKEIPI